MSMDLPGGLVEAKKVVQGWAERRDEFEMVISQDDPADDLNELELSEQRDGGVGVSSSYWFRDGSLAVVIVRALTPKGFSLVAIEDRMHYATGRFARTATS